MMISERASKINPSLTLAISAKAKAMRKQGEDVVIFGVGEPDFNTPQGIKQAAITAIEENFTRYTPASGILELKEAVVEKFRRDNGLEYSKDQVIISCGAKHTLYTALQVLCDVGDEVILFAPYWVSYPEMIQLAGAKAVVASTQQKDDFLPDIKTLESALSKKTKGLIVNSPCNPTGTVYPKELLEKIAQFAVKNNLWVISDEVYEKIIFGKEKHVSIATLGKEIKEHTLVVNAVSKTFCMTGWRIGYTAADTTIVKAMGNIQSHSTSNPNSIAQKAALEALREDGREIRAMVDEFEKRRDYVVERFKAIPQVSFSVPRGTFYIFVDIGNFLGAQSAKRIHSSLDFAKYLLDEAKVAVVPGSAFGSDRHIRISFATSQEELVKGLDRIEAILTEW